METGGSSGSSQPQTLKLSFQIAQEQKIYFEDVDAKSGGGLPPPVGGDGGSAPQKKGKAGAGAGVQGQQPPRCQVEGCNVDLSNVKTYYSRHKVCGVHSKTPMVTVNGLHQRFCQQCSRFHKLTEFDQGKRSCRKRLAGHNERRRKPPPGTMLSACYRSPSSSIIARGGRGLLMDFTTYSSAPLQWPNSRAFAAIEKYPPFQWQSNLDNPPPEGCFNGVSNSDCALSLLSNQSSGSRNHTSSLACYVGLGPNCGAAHMVPPAGDAMAHLSSTASWGYDPNGTLMVWDQSQQSAYPGELRLGQQYDSSAKSL